MIFYENAHLHVKTWEVGYTASGSSGSPLFNADGEIIGALSGGQSSENSPKNDYFFSLKKPWDAIDTPERQLKYWLNPSDDETKVCEGLDPYKSAPCFRLSNIYDSGNQENAECTLYPGSEKAYLFGNNPANITEYAEAYQVAEAGTLYGAYFVTPPAGANYKQMEVEVTVYSGDSKPSTLLYTETFQPTYSNKSILDDTFIETAKSLNRSQESYIHFSKPVNVSGKFYIGYKLKSVPENTYFSAYNLPKGKTTRNTAWVHDKNGWRQATEYTQAGFSTSLFIDPVIQYGNPVSNEKLEANEQVLIHLGPEKGMVHLVLPDGMEKATYTLHSAQGKVSENGEITDRQATLHFLKLTSGVYFLTVHYGEKHYTQKIIF
ncbi:T9SS type A sorting domain-containing protein [Parabacteroides distasonis]|uniref:T9SS type A sorting domain-containing protein n=1 Tax=Parabacteroides distasonis TaxID=823 RepID=UPI002165327B|nr:T9SS type A sorting domain-containing protein [Parabacteroides distasonis]MCS2606082.1 T9SS type A sorting domain-containing protein [Parabacteroides distasonis]